MPNPGSGTVSIVDGSTHRVTETLPLGPTPFPLRILYGDVWVPLAGGTEIVRVRP